MHFDCSFSTNQVNSRGNSSFNWHPQTKWIILHFLRPFPPRSVTKNYFSPILESWNTFFYYFPLKLINLIANFRSGQKFPIFWDHFHPILLPKTDFFGAETDRHTETAAKIPMLTGLEASPYLQAAPTCSTAIAVNHSWFACQLAAAPVNNSIWPRANSCPLAAFLWFSVNKFVSMLKTDGSLVRC